MNSPHNVDPSTPLQRWTAFASAVASDAIDLIGTEDAVAALIDRSLLQEDLDAGSELQPGDLVTLYRADHAFKAAAPALLDRTQVALFKDDEPVTHWWWHAEELVLGSASDLLLNVPQAADLKGVHPHTIRAAIRDGHLPARRLARGFLIHRRDLERWQPRRVGRPRGSTRPPTDLLLDAFNEANTRGDFARAHEVGRAIARDPSSPRRQLALALDSYNEGDHEEARQWTIAALDGELPDRSRQTALLVQGRALLYLGRASAAKRVLRQAQGMGHVDALVSAALADVEVALDRPTAAVEMARRAVTEAPDTIEMVLVLARAEWHDNRAWDALEHVVRFRSERPDDRDGMLLHCALLGFLGDRLADPRCYETILELVGRSTDVDVDFLHVAGMANARLGRFRPALAAIKRIMRATGDRDLAGHAAELIATALIGGLPLDDEVRAGKALDEMEAALGATDVTQGARAMLHARRGEVASTLSALGVASSRVLNAPVAAQQIVVYALLEAGRPDEARPVLRSVAEHADDPEIVRQAIKGAVAIEDLDLVRAGLQRLIDLEGQDGWVAMALQILDSAERRGRAEALASMTMGTAAGDLLVPREHRSPERTVESAWEGIHHAGSAIVDDLVRGILH